MKQALNCIIVDDEPLAQNLIEKFIDRVPYLALLAKYDNAIAAMDGIGRMKPDIVFLDVNMPEMSGIEFLGAFPNLRQHVIMTTAYPEYALDGFEYDVVDYLLKPVAFTRFVKAVNKVRDKLTLAALPGANPPPGAGPLPDLLLPAPDPAPKAPEKELSAGGKFFMVKEDKKLVKVNLDEIVFVEGMKDYVKIHLTNRFLVTHITMTKIAELLTPPQFIRINRSYILQVAFIKLIEGNMVETTQGKKLSIGINYRDAIKAAVQSWTI